MLHVHRAERADRLADGLAELLAVPLDDPFAPDVVSVPTRGVERWLAQRLSTRLGAGSGRQDGVCANVEFPFPGRLVGDALATATGVDPATDPWLPERAVWPLLETVDECLEEPWLAMLRNHLIPPGGEEDGLRPRRFGVVRHIADLFDRYGVQRPEMIQGWVAGEPSLRAGEDWQAELWRRLRARVGVPSPAERLEPACALIRERPDLLALPARMSLFGLTRMSRSVLDVLAAIAAEREVHLFVLHPSPALWEGVERETEQRDFPIGVRAEDRTAQLPRNRLLASWGRDARELQLVLEDPGVETRQHHHALDAPPPETLLARVQAHVREDVQPPGAPLPGAVEVRPALDPEDRTIQVHACHGRARQVEVLRDAVLHLLAEGATLEPRDVIVMCPDIETYAPLIHATFGAGAHARTEEDEDEDPAVRERRLPDIRVRLADRSLRQTNPVLSVVSQLLALADGRATASELLDLADRDPVRRRFGFDDDDITRIGDWIGESGIRWGFDAEHRKPFKLDRLEANTWRAGLDRVLLGVMASEEGRRLIGGVLPVDDVGSEAIELAGRFTEFVDRVQNAMDALRQAGPVEAFAAALVAAADSLVATGERDAWQRAELQRLLDDVVAEATGERPGEAPLELADVRALLADRLRGRPTRANFRTGHLTVCTLVPMRSVPHRVVCVLGLDDDEFPRKARRDGDDLLLREPHVGDRDSRAEDRQMLLDALMAATERLIITYTGNDERTNLPRPPAVPVGELLDIVDRTVARDGGLAREQVLVHHPLQPFDARNFTPGALVPERPWSFDGTSLAGARALTGARNDPPPFLDGSLPALEEGVIDLGSLVRFFEHPCRAFLRDRLQIRTGDHLAEVEDSIPVELDGLGAWGVGQRLLEGVLEGAGLEACVAAERARGQLPPGRLGETVLSQARHTVEQLVAELEKLAPGEAGSQNVSLSLPEGCALAGTVPGVRGDRLCTVTYSKLKPRERLVGWVRLLALTASQPELPFSSLVLGRSPSKWKTIAVACVAPLGGSADERRETALAHLAPLVDIYRRGMREPAPMACETSAAYADAVRHGRDVVKDAGKRWTTGYNDFDLEDKDPAHVLVYGPELPIEELLAEPPRSDEVGADWPAEASRFGSYARRVWDPLLEREGQSHR